MSSPAPSFRGKKADYVDLNVLGTHEDLWAE
jgi:hypothetical protein